MESLQGIAGVSIHLVGLCEYYIPHDRRHLPDASGYRLRCLSAVAPGFSDEACPGYAPAVHHDLRRGIVPNYLLIKELHLLNSRWVYVLPSAANAFQVLVMLSFFRSIPDALIEAARIDGARDIRILFRIVLPLSIPSLVTIGLWSLVHHINAFMDNLLYVTDQSKFVLQQVIRQILIENKLDPFTTATNLVPPAPESLKMASVIVCSLPVLIIYPFLLKYFEKGTMIGSVKG